MKWENLFSTVIFSAFHITFKELEALYDGSEKYHSTADSFLDVLMYVLAFQLLLVQGQFELINRMLLIPYLALLLAPV